MNTEQVFTVIALPQLLQALNHAMSYTDEEILELARQAEESHLQNQHYQALQRLRIQRHSVLYHFQQYWLNSLQPTCDKRHHTDSLSKLVTQFTLAKESPLLSDNRPNLIDAKPIFLSFIHALSHTELDLYNQILLLRQFEELMQNQLHDLQTICYQALAKEDIHPLSNEAPPLHQVENNSPSLLLTALETLKAQQQIQLATTLQNLVLQSASEPQPPSDFIQQLAEAGELDPSQIEPKDQQAVLSIQRLFTLIVGNQELDPKARAILLHLQLPYSCLALKDDSLLANSQSVPHYALDEMIRLASQWPNHEQSSQLPALQQKLIQTVQAFWYNPAQSKEAYQQILYDLLLFNDGLYQQQLHTTQQEQQAHNAEKQQQIVHQLIDETCHRYLSEACTPILSSELISSGWKPLLYQIASRYGDQSQSWENAIEVLQDLAASLKPAEAYANRNEFLLLLPNLLKKLKIGLSLVQTPQKISQWLQELAEEHISIAQSIPFADLDDERLEQARAAVAEFDWQLIVDHEKAVEQADTEGVDSFIKLETESDNSSGTDTLSPYEQQLAQLGAGSELRWHTGEVQSKRCRIAAYIKHTEQYIIIYPNGSKAAELSRTDLLEKLESGEIESLDSGRIFEDALASVIHGMRR